MTHTSDVNRPLDDECEHLLHTASILMRHGKIGEAERYYLAILDMQGEHAEANHRLGIISLQRQQLAESLAYFEAALDARPDHGPYWLSYLDALTQAGQYETSAQILEIAKQAGLSGDNIEALSEQIAKANHVLANSTLSTNQDTEIKDEPRQEEIDEIILAYSTGQFTACEVLTRVLRSRYPHHYFPWKILGALLKFQGKLPEAIFTMNKAIELAPNDPESLNNLGLTLKNTGHLNESKSILQRAISLSPKFAEAHNNLGVTLLAQGLFSEAEKCFNLAIKLQPTYPEPYCNLGICLKDQNRLAEAEAIFLHALSIRPSYAEVFNNLGTVFHLQGKLSESLTILRQAIELKPDFAVAYNNLGNTLHCMGEIDEAENCYRQALKLQPDYAEAYDGLLFSLNYHPDKSEDDIFDVYQEYNEVLCKKYEELWLPHTNSVEQKRKLKIGYVSSAFYKHPVANFLLPLLAHHEKSRFELYAYADLIKKDSTTSIYQSQIDHWRDIFGLTDEEVANRIRCDEIDILIDLAGHTGLNRLGVFARKPAPVSIHWLDFGYTTGLTAIDYYLSDIHNAPFGSERLFSEKIWRIASPAFAYRPSEGMGEAGPLPALTDGRIAFGTLTRAIRINHHTIRVWSQILQRVENSILIIDSNSYQDYATKRSLIDRFKAWGIDENRLEIGYHSPPWDVLRKIDIGLDCFPHNSGTTLYECLYMGIPIITLAGRVSVGRLGSTILNGVGHPEWIATNETEYRDFAVSLASDTSRLIALRADLRQQMLNSPIMDEKDFTRRVENAFTEMFKCWSSNPNHHIQCQQKAPIVNNHRDILRREQAVVSYNQAVDFQKADRTHEAEEKYLQAINIDHSFFEAFNNLGVIFQKEGKFTDAHACFAQAIRINKDYAPTYFNVANTYKLQQKLIQAEENYRKVIEILPSYVEAHYQLGNILQEQGKHTEAELSLREVLRLAPDHIKAFSTLLFTLNYHPDKTAEEIFQAYREFNAQFYQGLQAQWSPHSRDENNRRRLKIGYVAPDYRKHPARYFVEPLLAHHNKEEFEIFAYVQTTQENSTNDLFFKYVEHWLSTINKTDEELSRIIRDDKIDILVDLSGHTAGNRLAVFARKPAPVSLHWLDFGYTTGLTAIDYYLADEICLPQGCEPYFSETPWRINTPAQAYRPPDETGPVNSLPALKNGFVTFATLTRAVRINHRTIRVWSEILKGSSNSRLVVNSGSYKETAMQEALAVQFAAFGIARERLVIGCQSPPWDILRSIDIGLDCFPHNSGTTLVESLYMGVPFITLADRPSVGRLGGSLLQGIGHPEWIAQTEEEYIIKALSLAQDLPSLATLRSHLREEMVRSPLMDESGFTKKVETAYKKMFSYWKKTHRDSPIEDTVCNQPLCPMQQGVLPHHDHLTNPTALANPREPHKHRTAEAPQLGKEADIGQTTPDPDKIRTLLSFFEQHDYLQAEGLCKSLLEAHPNNSYLVKALATILHKQGRLDDALSVFHQAIALPNIDSELFNNYGNALAEKGNYPEAEANFLEAIRLGPRFMQAYFNMANTLQKMGRYGESEFFYHKAISLDKTFAAAYFNLGNTLVLQGKYEEAEKQYANAIKEQPDFSEACNNLGNCLEQRGAYFEAEKYIRRAIQINPQYAEAYNNLGNCYKSLSRIKESEECYRKALSLQPDNADIHSNLLFLMNNHPDKSRTEIFEDYKKFNNRFGLPHQPHWLPFTNTSAKSRRLRVGYISPQFRQHSIRYFLEPLLAQHDKSVVEIYAYSDTTINDNITEIYRSYVDHWRQTDKISDAELASVIRCDCLDILVDLSGHTGRNRLAVFARKPAPVSLHWLDFGYTTGLTAIDFYLTDFLTVPEGSEDLFSEIPWRIAHPSQVYRPAEGMGEVSPLPAITSGHITFGTLTRAVRINRRTIQAWTGILNRVANSHLIIDSSNFKDPAVQEEMAKTFVEYGIERHRLEIGFHSPPWDTLRKMDIGLDCFPHNSGTTLFETLYMGVPYITLADNPCVGLLGSSILHGIDHPEWIAKTEEEYIELAVALASNLPRLASLRATLRQKMERGPLMDEKSFARKIENAYRQMFERWWEQQQSSHPRPEHSTKISLAITEALQQAATCIEKNLLNEAEELYQSIRTLQPDHPDANFHLGQLSLAKQQPDLALSFFQTALQTAPEQGIYWIAVIETLLETHQFDMAQQCLETAIAAGLQGDETNALLQRLQREQKDSLVPFKTQGKGKATPASEEALDWRLLVSNLEAGESPDRVISILQGMLREKERSDNLEIHHCLGELLFSAKRYQEAEDIYRESLLIWPENAETHYFLANTLVECHKQEEAAEQYRKAIALKPDFVEALGNLANILQAQGHYSEAEKFFTQSLKINPNFHQAHFNLGNLLRVLHRLDESLLCYQQVIALQPNHFKAWSNLGIVLHMQGQLTLAEEKYRKALVLEPSFIEAHINLAACLKDQGKYREAETHLRKALDLNPNYALSYNNLGALLKEQGRISEAEEALRRALTLCPEYIEAHSNLLFLLNYHPDLSAEKIYDEYRFFDLRHGIPLRSSWQTHHNTPRARRRLKVGYVSPQFRMHSIRHFLEPLLSNHNKEKFEIFAYADVAQEDAVSARYRTYVNQWITTTNLSDEALTDRIRSDKIDILVDLSGHTAHNRLRVFAMKPAPVSLHWLDFGYTTGLSAIDYYLTDPVSTPIEYDCLFAETPWRIAPPSFVYRPNEDMGPVSPLPASSRGYVTFGTLTRAVRINHRTIDVWAEILRQVKGSHLVIDSSNFKNADACDDMRKHFVNRGIDPSRLQIGFHSPPWDILRDLDIGLDCFPHNSGTTLYEHLYMGTPYITLADRPSVGRLGSCILEGLGHPEWIALNEEQYIEIAVSLASDLTKLALIRKNLRKEMKTGPLMDEPGFARKVEDAFSKMFTKWCEQHKKEKRKSTTTISKKCCSALSEDQINHLISLFQQGNYRGGEIEARKLISLYPSHASAYILLAPLLSRQGRTAEAAEAAENAVSLFPNEYAAHYNQALIMQDQQDLAKAEQCYFRALQLNPRCAEAYGNLGNVQRLLNKLDEAEKNAHKALTLESSLIEARITLANIYKDRGSYKEAEEHYHIALQARMNNPEIYNNLAIVQKAQGNITEAIMSYRKALALQPDSPEILSNLGLTLKETDNLEEAEHCCRQAIQLHPHLAEAYNNLGIILAFKSRFREAEDCYRNALAINPNYAEAYCNLVPVLGTLNRRAEAEECYQQALRCKPDFLLAHSNLLFLLNYDPDKSAEEIFAEYIKFDAQFGIPQNTTWRTHNNTRDPNKKLRVGYISGDFRKHSTRHFLLPLIENHDRTKIEIFAYADVAAEDSVTNQYKQAVDHWCVTEGMADDKIAQRVREDEIDILVELSGHTAKNRLGVFSRKPAPVSVSWLGYGYTTGLTAIDYFLTDEESVPPGSENLFAELPWKLKNPCYVYRPAENMGEINTLPALKRGYVTFGTLTRAIRINHRVIKTWAAILKQTPGAHLLIDSSDFKNQDESQVLMQQFQIYGIEKNRLEIGFHSPPWDILRSMDIGLDCFPHNSGTTLYEHLYMGIPFISLADRPSVGRLGSCILHGVGHPEWIAKTEDEYVAIAISLSSDLQLLQKIRANLRREMLESPLMDESGFARKVEGAYQQMFRNWCKERG